MEPALSSDHSGLGRPQPCIASIETAGLPSHDAAKYRDVRDEIADELPELIGRHHDRLAAFDHLAELLTQLKTGREERGLTLADLTELTGMDPSALSKLESGQRPNPTLETLVRYAEAVGKRIEVSLTDARS